MTAGGGLEVETEVLSPALESVEHARHFVRSVIADTPMSSKVDDILLVVSELATNAVLHTSAPFTVRVVHDPARSALRVEILDAAANRLPEMAPPSDEFLAATELLDEGHEIADAERLLLAESMTGRGLRLVDALSDAWGTNLLGDGRKVVWACFGDLALPTPAATAAAKREPVLGLRPVRLIGLPVRLVHENERNIEDLVRELRTQPSPALEPFADITRGGLAPAERLRVAARAETKVAIAEGRRVITVEAAVPADAPARLAELLGALEQLAERSRSGELLSLAPSAELTAFRKWIAGELARQLTGAAPVPCPFPVLRADDPAIVEAARRADRIPAPEVADLAVARLACLAGAATELARADSLADVSRVALTAATFELGAATTSLSLLAEDGQTVQLVEAIGYPQDVLDRWTDYFVGDDVPASEAVRTGEGVWLRDRGELLARYPVFRRTPIVNSASTAVLPLAIDADRRVGAIALGFSDAQAFPPVDRAFLSALAASTSQAIARIRLAEAERASRERLAFLASASEALNRSLELAAVGSALARAAVPRLADWCSIHVVEDGRVVLVGVAHAEPQAEALAREVLERWPAQLDRPGAITEALTAGAPLRFQLAPETLLAAIARDQQHLTLLRELGLGSGMVLPIQATGRVLGVITLCNALGRLVSDDEFDLAQDLAQRAGAAFENALLFAARESAAAMLQASLLPAALPGSDRVAFVGRYRPASQGLEVGGDFYDVVQRRDGTFVAFVGDVRGHGVEAAAVASIARHTVRALAEQVDEPVGLLDRVNTMLLRDVDPGSIEPRLCSIAACYVEAGEAGRAVGVRLSSGGHPQPFVRRSSGAVEQVELRGDLLGLGPDPELGEAAVELSPGDMLVLFTDGVSERHADGRFFDDAGVERSLQGAPPDPAGVADRLLDDALAFVDRAPHDDMAVLVIAAG